MEAKELKEFKKRIELLKLHFDCIADDLILKADISKATFYRLVAGDYSEKTIRMMATNLGVSYDWLRDGKGEMIKIETKSKLPEITTKSTDPGVQALIQQANFLQAQLIEKDAVIKGLQEQIAETGVIIKSLVKPSPRIRHHSFVTNRGVLVATRLG